MHQAHLLDLYRGVSTDLAPSQVTSSQRRFKSSQVANPHNSFSRAPGGRCYGICPTALHNHWRYNSFCIERIAFSNNEPIRFQIEIASNRIFSIPSTAFVMPSQMTQPHPQSLARSSSQRRIFQETPAVVAITADLCLVHKRQ